MSDLDSIIINLKSCLVSTKNGIPLNQIESDYFKLNGERIPFKSLGFSSLENLLLSSEKFTITNYGGVSVVQALATNKTQHLTELIKKQKSKPPKKKPFMGSKTVLRKINTPSNYNRPNNYSRQGNNSTSYPRNNYQGSSISNYTNTQKISTSYNNSRPNHYNSDQPKMYEQNNYNKPQPPITYNLYNFSNNTNYGNNQSNSAACLAELKTFQQNNRFNNDSKNDLNPSVPKDTYPLNGKSNNKPQKKLPLTDSCSSLESTYSSSSASYTPRSTPINPQDKFQISNNVNIDSQIVNKNNKDTNPKNNIYKQEKNSELKLSTQQYIAKHSSKINMSIKPSDKTTAQNRLKKYPKKCDELLSKINDNEDKFQEEEPLFAQTADLIVEDSDSEVIDNQDYIGELESYLKNLNLSEPYYDCMAKKEKFGKGIKCSHICAIKVNEKSVSSSFPVECSTVDSAKKVAAKHALTTLKKQYGENVVYPITNDINTIASRIKEFLKTGYEETGLMGDVLERMYREQFQENLPDNWVQLLEVYSYFKFDKLVANKIIIYLNEIENNLHSFNGDINGYHEATVEEQNIVPGTPLKFENYDEKSVLVSANYGSASVWIRFVGQSADENFIQMQAKFNDSMNTAGVCIVEQVNEGEFYAVLYNSSWHRVLISGPLEDDIVTCFMVDTGEQLNISKDQICYLEPVFMKTKTQAIECVLTQLENFRTFDGLKELLDEMLLNKTFFLVPDSIEDGCFRVTLYEKNEISDRINVNDMIIQRFLEKTVAKLPSFNDNVVVDGTVTSVVDSGHLYLQLNFEVVASLEEILPGDEHLNQELFLKSKDDVKKDEIYLIMYEADNMWSRVQVLEIDNDSEAKIIYIDYGNIAKCEITKLFNLSLFDPLMAKIPPQAIKVSMYLLPPSVMTSDIANKIFEIIGSDKVLVSVIHENEVPCIQLFKTQPDSPEIPLCINMLLAQSLKNQETTMH